MPANACEDLAAVVLAGGFGTRVRHVLPGIPKPMAPVAGRPFLEWVVRFLARQGVCQVVLSTGYLAEVIARHFDPGPVAGVRVMCVPETEPLGTAGGFLHAARHSGLRPTSWLVLNGDSLCFGSLSEAKVRLGYGAGLLLGCAVPDASRYGTLAIGADGQLLAFAEKRPGQGIINAGVYLLSASLLPAFPERRPLSFEQDVFPTLAAHGVALGVSTVPGPFLDIGTPESLNEAEAFIRANQSEFLL